MSATLLQTRREQMFPKLTAIQLGRIEQHSTRRETQTGDVLLEAGGQPRGMFIVTAGSVEILVPTADVHSETCEYVLLYVLTAGDFSGEMNTLRGAPGLARLRVDEGGSVLELRLEDLRRLVQSDAELSEIFMRAFILRRMGVLESGHSEVTVLGNSASGDTLQIREFLTRNARPHVYVDIDSDIDSRTILERFHVGAEELPVVICRGGEVLKNPELSRLADCVGINAARNDNVVHDLVVIGAGPAGLAAAVYAASEGVDTALIDTFAPGGQAGTSSRIENYLGFPTGISGAALANRALSQAQKFGAQLSVAWHAVRLRCDQWPYAVEMSNGRLVRGRTILIASGAQYRTLGASGSQRFLGNGVYYAATHLEARLCEGEDAIVVGGGNSAGQAAVFLAGHCRRVEIFVRSSGLAESMSSYLIRRIESTPNISLHTHTEITALDGESHLARVTWVDASGAIESRALRHVFLMLGALPNTRWLDKCVAVDDAGFVRTGPDLRPEDLGAWLPARSPYLLETNIPGVFAAGDARCGSTKRIATAVGEGSTTVQFVHRALRELVEADQLSAVAVS